MKLFVLIIALLFPPIAAAQPSADQGQNKDEARRQLCLFVIKETLHIRYWEYICDNKVADEKLSENIHLHVRGWVRYNNEPERGLNAGARAFVEFHW